MMKNFLVILLFITSVLNVSVYAQDAEFPNMPVSTGNKKSSISLNTGAVSHSVPIWQVNQDDLSIPVYLSYNSNGIKVSEVGGNVGLGWNLTIGGSISVEQRGLYDLKSGNSPTEGSGFKQSGNFVTNIPLDLEFLMNSVHGSLNDEFSDTEPDIFHYNFPGSSGKFVFNNAGEIVSLTDKSLIIEYLPTVNSPSNDQITIIDSYGIKYSFKCREYEEDEEPVSPNFALCKIENVNTGNSIEINSSQRSYSKDIETGRFFKYKCEGEVEEQYSFTQNSDITNHITMSFS